MISGSGSRCVGDRSELRKYLVRPGEPDDGLYGPRQRREGDLTTTRVDLPVDRKDGAQARRVEAAGVREVEHELLDTLRELLLAEPLEVSGIAKVQSLSDAHNDGVGASRFSE